MTPIRVLRVIARMNVGGPALQVSALARHLDPARFEQRLLVGSVGPGEADYLDLRASDVEVVRVPGLGRAPRVSDDARALAVILREIRRFGPDVVHTHTAKAGVLGRSAAVVARVPWRVHTFHGHLLQGYFSPRVTRAVVLTERTLARATTRLVAVGQRVRDDLLAAGIGCPSQYVVVPPGVELPAAPAKEEARATLGLPPGVPVVAYVARLTQVKRPDRFVATATQLAARFPEARFIVAGEGQLLADMRLQAAALGDRVHFLGWRPDVETVYAAADVTVLTSDNEGMPVSLIEAAMAGCPAVTTRVGSAAEVVLDGVTGFVTDTEPAAIAEAAGRLLADPGLRSRFAAAAADHADHRFSHHRLIGDIAALYESLVQEHGCVRTRDGRGRVHRFASGRGPSRPRR
jgi:glycosyltransferase involved in cell wall biosynthesis